MTETTLAVTFVSATKPLKAGSVGEPLPNTELQVHGLYTPVLYFVR